MPNGKPPTLLGVLGLLIALIASACGGGEATTPQPSGTSAVPAPTATRPAATATPRAKVPGGTATVALAGLQSDWTPWNVGSSNQQLYSAMADSLLTWNEQTLAVGPGLADRWDMAADGLRWSFHLRPGVKFHDGQGEVTSADVKYLFDRMVDSASRHGYVKQFKNAIDRVETVGGSTVDVYFKALMVDFGSWMSNYKFFYVVPKAYHESVGDAGFNKKPVGTGPYRFVEHATGDHVKYEATAETLGPHWRVGIPDYKTIVLRQVNEDVTRLAGLRTGEIDVGQVPLSLLSQVTGAQGINLQKVPGSYATVMVLGGQFPPTHKAYDPKTRFLDLRIRKALNLAVNRDELFQTFYKGAAQPATLPFLIPGWDSLKPYPFDAAQAKTLLREANYPNGFEVTVQSFARGRAEVPSVVEGLCLQLGQVGVRCKINPTDYDTWRPNWPAFKGADMMWPFSWGFEPDYEGTLAITFGHKMAFPWAWDQKVADLLNTLVGVADPQKRKAIYNDVAKAMYEAYTVIPLGLVDDLWATNAKTIAKDWRPTNMQERVGWETIRKP